ncbi:TPA: hypothetical protein HA225_00785 [Candidatus Micrarchaeota archaeon]|nr:hypothetical protein [Candidatus Micrarchaeota archaeon]HIH30045.1 hypothetical protein [Candidatus Micrarchaeota archaeon]
MPEEPAAYPELDRRWNSACRILLGRELGGLDDFAPYLSRYVEPLFEKASFLSGKKALVSLPNFSRKAVFISNDEQELYAKRTSHQPLSINEVKDMDSIISAVSERIAYSGNIITGNSRFVEQSSSIVDSAYVYRSSDYYGASYVAYSSNGRFDQYVFGCNWTGESKFIISSHDTYKLTRCFETLRCFTSSDCYYSANLEDCADCLFSFNQRSRRNLIGNLALPKDEYSSLKSKLVSEMAESMQRKKSVKSIIEIIRD